jgi:hypothetical protein
MQARLIVSAALFVVVGRLRANICLEELKIAFRGLGSGHLYGCDWLEEVSA